MISKKMHEGLSELMWDLACVEVREAKLIECLANNFAARLKNAGWFIKMLSFLLSTLHTTFEHS